jgi:PAS domain S-box-containing protein
MTAIAPPAAAPLVDLAQCEAEPIHIPGSLQPHGVLLALHGPALVITQASSTCEALLGRTLEELLGRELAAALGAPLADEVRAARRRHEELPDVLASFAWTHSAGERAFTGYVHTSEGLAVLELEPAPAVPRALGDVLPRAARVASLLRAQPGVPQKAAVAAAWLRAMTGYDRVMVYRFHDDWHGEIIAEARDEALEPYLGLHYPASDIPPQARRMYLASPTRVIVDVAYTPATILPATNPATARPLDLSQSTLRSVSPVHLEYLRNMGVGATLVTSLRRGGELWGLIACHHRAAHTVTHGEREIVDWMAQELSAQIVTVEEAQSRQHTAHLTRCRDHVILAMHEGARLPALLRSPQLANLLAAVGAEGMALVHGAEITTGGVTPAPERIRAIVDALHDRLLNEPSGVFATECLGEHLPEAADLAAVAAGLGMFPLSDARPMRLVWFRGEQLRLVKWGGNPDKAMSVSSEGRLSPRKSFEAWTESVRARSVRWEAEELASARELGVMLDLELRHVAEDALRASEVLVHDLVDALTAHIAVLNDRGVITSVNRAWLAFAEANHGGLECNVGVNYLDVCARTMAGQDAKNARAATQGIREVLAGTRTYFSLEYPCHSPSEQRWFVMRVYPLSGPKPGAVIAHEDVTAARVTAEALERERQRYRTLVAISTDGIHVVDERGLLVEANDAFLRMIGQPREAVGTLHVRDWDPNVPAAELETGLQAMMNTPRVFETQHRHRDGALLDVEISAGGVELEGNSFLLAASRDITKRKQLEESLTGKQAQLEELNRSLESRVEGAIAELRAKDQLLITQSRQAAMGEMIGNIAHQWRQPLNALGIILANLRDASRYGELDGAGVEEAVKDSNRLIQKMSTTINDFRDFFGPEKEKRVFSALGQITETLHLVDASYRNALITLELEAVSDVSLFGFSNEYSQVLMNLLSNAKQAIQAAKAAAPGKVTLWLGRRDGLGCLTVRDNGGGIPAAMLDKIFEPYFSTREGGTGIGLYMSRQIAERSLGGRLEATNVDGGAEFALFTPLAQGSVAPRAPRR